MRLGSALPLAACWLVLLWAPGRLGQLAPISPPFLQGSTNVPGQAVVGTPFQTTVEPNVGDCSRECRKDRSCRAYNFNRTSGGCELFDYLARVTDYVAQPTEANVSSGIIYTWIDIPDLESEPWDSNSIYGDSGYTIADCADLCEFLASDPTPCTVWVFHHDDKLDENYCELYNVDPSTHQLSSTDFIAQDGEMELGVATGFFGNEGHVPYENGYKETIISTSRVLDAFGECLAHDLRPAVVWSASDSIAATALLENKSISDAWIALAHWSELDVSTCFDLVWNLGEGPTAGPGASTFPGPCSSDWEDNLEGYHAFDNNPSELGGTTALKDDGDFEKKFASAISGGLSSRQGLCSSPMCALHEYLGSDGLCRQLRQCLPNEREVVAPLATPTTCMDARGHFRPCNIIGDRECTLNVDPFHADVPVNNRTSTWVSIASHPTVLHHVPDVPTLLPARDAAAFCAGQGAALPTIYSTAHELELQAALLAAGYTDPVWLGLTDGGQEGVWLWTSDPANTHQNWDASQPSNFGNLDCATLDPGTGRHSAASCSSATTTVAVVCQREPTAAYVTAGSKKLVALGSSASSYSHAAFQCEEMGGSLPLLAEPFDLVDLSVASFQSLRFWVDLEHHVGQYFWGDGTAMSTAHEALVSRPRTSAEDCLFWTPVSHQFHPVKCDSSFVLDVVCALDAVSVVSEGAVLIHFGPGKEGNHTARDYGDARLFCEGRNSTLPVVDTPQALETFRSFRAPSWIGLDFDPAGDRYIWNNDPTQEAQSDFWALTHPRAGQCSTVNINGNWESAFCSDPFIDFMCQRLAESSSGAILAPCPADHYQSTLLSADGDRVCKPCTACAPGTFLSAPCTEALDATCLPCPPGSHNNVSTEEVCRDHDFCGMHTEWGLSQGRLLLYVREQVTFAEAQIACRQLDAELFSPEAGGALHELSLQLSQPIWLGLRATDFAQFRWPSGNLTNFTAFSTGPLRPDIHPCVQSTAGVWHNTTCETTSDFVCTRVYRPNEWEPSKSNLETKLMLQPVTYIEARALCQDEGATLITSPTNETLFPTAEYWVGLTTPNETEPQVWAWEDGTVVAPGLFNEAAAPLLGCGFYTNTLQLTSNCNERRPFVCARVPTTFDTCLSSNSVQAAPLSPQHDRVCASHSPCPNAVTPWGGFSCHAQNCSKCDTPCPPGLFVASECTATEERECLPCPPGTFSAQNNALECTAFTATCPNGTFKDFPDLPIQDLVCTTIRACSATEYESAPPTATSDRVCPTLRNCIFDEFESVAPTATSDRVCEPHPYAVRGDLFNDMLLAASSGVNVMDKTKTGLWHTTTNVGGTLPFDHTVSEFRDGDTFMRASATHSMVEVTTASLAAMPLVLRWETDIIGHIRLNITVEAALTGPRVYHLLAKTIEGQLIHDGFITSTQVTIVSGEVCINQGFELVISSPESPDDSSLLFNVRLETGLSAPPGFVEELLPPEDLFVFAKTAEPGAIVIDTTLDVPCGIATTQLQDEGDAFEISASNGFLAYTGNTKSGARCLELTASLDLPVCFTAEGYEAAPCSTLMRICYLGIPPVENVTANVILKDDSETVTYEEPRAPNVPFLRIKGTDFESPTTDLGFGTHVGKYVIRIKSSASPFPGILVHDSVPPIRATINVLYGEILNVNTVGHAFKADLALTLDFLADSGGLHDGGAPFPILQTSLLDNPAGTSLNFRPQDRDTFFLDLPPGLTSKLYIEATYCRQGTFKSEFRPSDLTEIGHTLISVDGIELNSFDGGSKYSPDGRCFSMKAATDTIDEPIEIGAITATFTVNGTAATTSRRRGLSFSPEPYVVMTWSQFALATLNTVTDPGGIVIIQDNQPPVFTFCPGDVEIEVEPFKEHAPANFTTPAATDNAGSPTLTASIAQGDLLSLSGSPHTVFFQAVDAANLVAVCIFRIIVRPAAGHTVTVPAEVRQFTTLPPELLESPFQQYAIHSDVLVGDGLPAIQFTFDPTVGLALELLLEPPAGELFGLGYSTTSGLPERVVLSVDLMLRNPNATEAALPLGHQGQAFTSVDIISVRNSSDDQVLNDTSIFPNTAEQTVMYLEPGEEFIRLRGESLAFEPSDVNFQALSISLQYPLGENGSAPFDLVLLNNSFVAFTYFYSEARGALFPAPDRDGNLQFYDANPPSVLTCPPDQEVFVTSNATGAVVTWAEPTFSDDRGVSSVSHNFQTGDFLPITSPGEPHVVTSTAQDASRNVATCTFNVLVSDRFAPNLRCPTTTSFPADAASNATVVSLATLMLTDNSGNATLAALERRRELGSHNLTLIAADAAGNHASCHWNFEVVDVTNPTIQCPALLVQQELSDGTGFDGLITAADNSGQVTLTHGLVGGAPGSAVGFAFEVGQYSLVSVAVDASGNTASCTWQIAFFDSALGAQGATASGGVDTTLVVGLILGVAALLVVVAVVVMRRRNKQQPHDFNELMEELQRIEGVRYDGEGPVAPRELKRAHVTTLTMLGKGNFGEVKKGLMNEGNGIPDYLVAIKLHLGEFEGRQEMLQEAAIMAQFRHPNIVALVGVVTAGDPLLIVLEYCELGELKGYLVDNDTDLKFKVRAARDCASGMAYLASRGFVHRDIAARNCLISSDYRFKISDFGLSRDTEDSEYYQSRGGAMPVRWTAPEALEERKFSPKSDCWSYGIMLYEIFTRARMPYKGWSNQKVWAQVCGGHRLPAPQDCPEQIYGIMLRCWDAEPIERPLFEELEQFFNVLLTMEDIESEAAEAPPGDLAEYALAATDQQQQNAPTYVDFMTEESAARLEADGGVPLPFVQPRKPTVKHKPGHALSNPNPYAEEHDPASCAAAGSSLPPPPPFPAPAPESLYEIASSEQPALYEVARAEAEPGAYDERTMPNAGGAVYEMPLPAFESPARQSATTFDLGPDTAIDIGSAVGSEAGSETGSAPGGLQRKRTHAATIRYSEMATNPVNSRSRSSTMTNHRRHSYGLDSVKLDDALAGYLTLHPNRDSFAAISEADSASTRVPSPLPDQDVLY